MDYKFSGLHDINDSMPRIATAVHALSTHRCSPDRIHFGKKNCHLPCYLTTFLHGQCHFKFSYHIDQQNFIEFFTTCLSIVCFYEKRGFRTSFSHFHKLPMNNVVFNFTYLSYIQCFSGVASIEWKLLSKNSKVTGSCLPVHSGEGSYTSHFVNKISCFHR